MVKRRVTSDPDFQHPFSSSRFLRNPSELKSIKNISLLRQQMEAQAAAQKMSQHSQSVPFRLCWLRRRRPEVRPGRRADRFDARRRGEGGPPDAREAGTRPPIFVKRRPGRGRFGEGSWAVGPEARIRFPTPHSPRLDQDWKLLKNCNKQTRNNWDEVLDLNFWRFNVSTTWSAMSSSMRRRPLYRVDNTEWVDQSCLWIKRTNEIQSDTNLLWDYLDNNI